MNDSLSFIEMCRLREPSRGADLTNTLSLQVLPYLQEDCNHGGARSRYLMPLLSHYLLQQKEKNDKAMVL